MDYTFSHIHWLGSHLDDVEALSRGVFGVRFRNRRILVASDEVGVVIELRLVFLEELGVLGFSPSVWLVEFDRPLQRGDRGDSILPVLGDP